LGNTVQYILKQNYKITNAGELAAARASYAATATAAPTTGAVAGAATSKPPVSGATPGSGTAGTVAPNPKYNEVFGKLSKESQSMVDEVYGHIKFNPNDVSSVAASASKLDLKSSLTLRHKNYLMLNVKETEALLMRCGYEDKVIKEVLKPFKLQSRGLTAIKALPIVMAAEEIVINSKE
jgi:hypothetical protein